MADLPSVKMKKRANIAIMMGTLAFAAVVAGNLFKIMVVDAKFYQDKADSTQFGATKLPASRGAIYSSDGKILAQSATAFTVFLDPVTFRKNDENKKTEEGQSVKELMISFLSDNLGVSDLTIEKAMRVKNSQYEVLAKEIELPVSDKINAFIEKHGITSLKLEENTKRYYPQDDLAASVVGFLNYDGDGQYGIEYKYNEYLSGVDGVIISAKDAENEQMPYRYSKLYEAKDGNSVHLTIDSMIQYYVESALDSAVEDHGAKENGCAIVMNAKTGAVLAMYTAPGFDLNNKGVLSEADQLLLEDESRNKDITEANLLEKMWKNKAISTINEPGSVFKVFTSSAALEEKKVSFDSSFTCNGVYEVWGEKIGCHKKTGHGVQTFLDALSNSCNPAFMQIGLELGAEKFSYYADAFGLREKTGIDLPGEVNSAFVTGNELMDSDVTLASSSFGQTNSLTAIQMITGYTAAINGGYLLKPYVVDKVVDSENNIIKKNEKTIKRQVISAETSALMREALQNNVDSKSTGNAYISGYKIGGKSGTAEKLSKLDSDTREYKKILAENPEKAASLQAPVKQYVASYCAFAPADDPEIVVYVAVDEPDLSDYYGSSVAAPCVRKIMEDVLPYMGYYPEYTEEELLNIDVRIPDVEDMDTKSAVSELEKAGFEVDVRGEGENVIAQVPSFTNSMPSGGKVILYTEPGTEPEDNVVMPNLKKMKIKEVNDLFSKLGLNLKTTGSQNEDAVVLSQSVDENTLIKEGTIVSVHFGIDNQSG
ncbi:MAG: penicillin-binding transpeptidase domain-containing protein [Oscillospiraceae bacterium]|nr:penicillin-binding transpeptidase domain-containing protein [Oscillospiraceae bacterium]